MGTLACLAMCRNPVCHFDTRLRVPSGVMASWRCVEWLNLSTTTSVSDTDLFFRTTGIPPIARKKQLQRPHKPLGFHQESGFSAHGDISQFPKDEVPIAGVGATQMIHFGASGTVIDTFQPKILRIRADRFILILAHFNTRTLICVRRQGMSSFICFTISMARSANSLRSLRNADLL